MSALASSQASISSSANAVIAQMPHAVWRANQMASYPAQAIPTGYRALDQELPHQGWPHSALIELLLQQPGIGEMQLLRPALSIIGKTRRIAMIQPPHVPQAATWSGWGLPPEHLLWLKTGRTADALWSAEQILRNGSCGAVLMWQTHSRPVALRRLQLAAQETDTVLWLIRPMANAQDASPAPLRLGLRPALAGVEVTFIKRRGPHTDMPLYLPLENMPSTSIVSTSTHHAFMDRRSPAPASAGSIAAVLE